MLTPDNILLAVKPIAMRRGIDTLTQYVQREIKSAWNEGAAFVCTNKTISRIKPKFTDEHWNSFEQKILAGRSHREVAQ